LIPVKTDVGLVCEINIASGCRIITGTCIKTGVNIVEIIISTFEI